MYPPPNWYWCKESHGLRKRNDIIEKKSKKDGKDQESIQSSTTPLPIAGEFAGME